MGHCLRVPQSSRVSVFFARHSAVTSNSTASTVMKYSRLPSVKLAERVSRLRLTIRRRAGRLSKEDQPQPRCPHLVQFQTDRIQLLIFLPPSLYARTLIHRLSSTNTIQLDQDPRSRRVVRRPTKPPIMIPGTVSLEIQLPQDTTTLATRDLCTPTGIPLNLDQTNTHNLSRRTVRARGILLAIGLAAYESSNFLGLCCRLCCIGLIA